MSFLETDDDRAALEEALRFIDEFGLTPDADDPPGSNAPTGSKAAAAGGRKHPKRVRDPAVYARRRSKQKNEVAELRQQAKALERQLLSLVRAPRLSGSGGHRATSSKSRAGRMPKASPRELAWLMAATKEQLARQMSELTNAELRQALETQWAASRLLFERVGELSDPAVSTLLYRNTSVRWLTLTRCALASQQVEIGRELYRFLVCSHAARMTPPRPIDDDPAVADIASQLLATAQRLVQEATSFQGLAVHAVTNECSIKHDPDVGMYTEARGAAPLGGNAENLLAYMLDKLCTIKFPPHSATRMAGMVRCTLAACNDVRTVGTDRVPCVSGQTLTRKKHEVADMALQGSPMRLSGVTVLHQSTGTDRLVFAYSTLFFHPSGSLCVREGGWFAVHKSPWNAASACEFRSCTRVASDVTNRGSALDGVAIRDVQSLVTAALAEGSRRRFQAVQRGLLLEAGRADLAGLLPPIDPSVNAAVYREA